MPTQSLNTPVLFLVFNRLDVTKQVFESIKQAEPPKLYLAADGARPRIEGEGEKVKAVRDYITSNTDWKCEIKTLFREENLGCKYAVSGAIDWFFENEEQGIILEDDCLPSQSFFWYCEELLNKYREDQRVFLISGYNREDEWKHSENDYFFSSYGGIWGWASWRRAWQNYDLEMNDLKSFSDYGNFENLLGKKEGRIRKALIESVNDEHICTWDYQWAFTRHVNGALACVPSKSLIKNIGFGADATHTAKLEQDTISRHELEFPLRHNPFFVPDRDYDYLFIRPKSFYTKLIGKLKHIYNRSK